ncbi:cadherin-7-like [Glandiceps talaboti]
MAQDMSEDDPKLNSTVEVEVTILDVNDNPPQFTNQPYNGKVSEIDRASSSILTVTATDDDIDLNGLVVYRIKDAIYPTSNFYIEEHTGILRNTRMLSGMGDQQFTLTVEAYNVNNQSMSNEATVMITVTEPPPENDRLLFESYTYTNVIQYDHDAASNIVTVTATYDGMVSADTNYNIIAEVFEIPDSYGLETSVFKIEESNGSISLGSDLGTNDAGRYTLDVEAYNSSNSNTYMTGQYDVTQVLITVVGRNNSAPVFSSSHYFGEVNDVDDEDTYILTVYANDTDSPTFGIGDIYYDFGKGDEWIQEKHNMVTSSYQYDFLKM